MRRSIAAVAAGMFLTAVIATGLVRSAGADTTTTTTSSTTTTIQLATWFDEAEIVIPPVVIVPHDIDHDGGLVVVQYDTPAMTAEPSSFFGVGAVRPSVWTLLAEDGSYTTETDPGANRVVFDVGFDFDPDSITALRLDGYVLRSPLQTWFLPAPDDFTVHEIAPGVTAALDIVQEQSGGAIVRVQLTADRIGAVADLAAEGVGPGWVVASSNFGGGGLWTLTYEGETLPDPLPIRVRGVVWIPIETALATDLDGVS